MRLDINKQDWQLIDFALTNVQGRDRRHKDELESLRLRLTAQFQPTSIPHRPTFITPIRSAWPTGDIKRTTKQNGFFDPNESKKVKLNNSNAQQREARVDDVLEGLI